MATRTFDFDRFFGEQITGCADGFHLVAFRAGDLTLIVTVDEDFGDRHTGFLMHGDYERDFLSVWPYSNLSYGVWIERSAALNPSSVVDASARIRRWGFNEVV